MLLVLGHYVGIKMSKIAATIELDLKECDDAAYRENRANAALPLPPPPPVSGILYRQ